MVDSAASRILSVFSDTGSLLWRDESPAHAGPLCCSVSEDGSVVVAVCKDEGPSAGVIVKCYEGNTGHLISDICVPAQGQGRAPAAASGLAVSPDGLLICLCLRAAGSGSSGSVVVLTSRGDTVSSTERFTNPSCRWLDDRTLSVRHERATDLYSFDPLSVRRER